MSQDMNEPLLHAARRMERLRQSNPINGDGANYMLSKAEQVLIDYFPQCLDAIVDERRVVQAEDEARYQRLLAEHRERLAREAEDAPQAAVEAPVSAEEPGDVPTEVQR